VILDGLSFIGDSLTRGLVTGSDLVQNLDQAQIDRAIVCPLKPRGYDLRAGNEYVARAVHERPDRLIGFARVDPHLGDAAAEELRHAVEALGLRGLFLHPWEETFRANAPLIDPVMRKAEELRVPVIIATGYPWLCESPQVGALAASFPAVPLLATNGAQMNISGFGQVDAELALRDAPNLRIHTTGVYREDFLQGIERSLGADRLIFASAFPYFDPSFELARVTRAHLSDHAKELILGRNLAELLRGPGLGVHR
jgi:predicted TIM-barrel fold metal-dependent hydrolase